MEWIIEFTLEVIRDRRFCNVINSEFKEKVKLLSKPLHYSEYAKQNKNDIDLQVYQFYLSRTN